MPRRWFAVLCLALVAVGCATTAPLDPRRARFAPPVFEPPEPVVRELSGGAPVFLLEDHDLPLVRLTLSFRGGSLYDPPGQAGLAAVTGPAWRTGGTAAYSPEALDEALDERAIELSVSLGRSSGRLGLSALRWDLAPALDLLEEVLLRPGFREERVVWARTQVQERLLREADNPQTLAFREFRRAMYPGHPRGVLATVESVATVGRPEVVGLHRRLLTEGAWVLGAVGDFDAATLLAELERRFGTLPAAGGAFPTLPPPPPPAPRVVLVPKDLPQATLVWGRLGPRRLDPEYYALDLVDQVVGGSGFQSRLVREVRSNRGLAYSVGSFYQALPGFGVLGASAQTRGDAVVEVRGAVAAILGQVAAAGITAEELSRARDAAVNRHVFRYQDPGSAVWERMGLWLDELPADLPARYLPAVLAVDREAARSAARWFGTDAGVTVVVGPLTSADLETPGGPPVEVVNAH
jgi:zinc protease